MNTMEDQERLSDMTTDWTLLRQLRDGSGDTVQAAQELILKHYQWAVYSYLRKAVGAVAAEDLSQEFAVTLLKGGFRHADPQKGRFRDYIRAALFNLVREHHRRTGKGPRLGL